jgi:hypothetical protein
MFTKYVICKFAFLCGIYIYVQQIIFNLFVSFVFSIFYRNHKEDITAKSVDHKAITTLMQIHSWAARNLGRVAN